MVDSTGDFHGYSCPRPWFVLRVETGHELSASTHLSSREIEHYTPTYTQRRKYAHTRAELIPRALFPGYIFARFPIHLKSLTLDTPYVYDLLTFDRRPASIDDEEITRVRRLVSTGPPTPWSKLIVGSQVVVKVGSMAGMQGVVAQINGDCHFVVNVVMLGRAVSVKITDPEMLEAA